MEEPKTQSHLSPKHHHHPLHRLKVRWPVLVALFSVAVLYEALPEALYWGPRGLMMGLVGALIVLMLVTLLTGRTRVNRLLGLLVNSLITVYMITSIIRIVAAVMHGTIGPMHLILSSMALWAANILVFALWYWNLDAGGPNKRELQESSWFGAFIFPQMQIALSKNKHLPGMITNWEPHFIDYLFLAFNTSTAFSPTDTPVLSPWAKIMSMLQALISLTIVVMLAARAINIIAPAANYIAS